MRWPRIWTNASATCDLSEGGEVAGICVPKSASSAAKLAVSTACVVAEALGRNSVGIELNPDYIEMARKRVAGVTPSLFAEAGR